MIASDDLISRANEEIDQAFNTYTDRFDIFAGKLEALGKRGLTAEQFALYRENFFYRTETTTPMLSALLDKATRHRPPDQTTLKLITTIYSEEIGLQGGQMHRTLLEVSHNIHGAFVFELPELNLDSDASDYLLPATAEYRRTQSALYEGGDLLTALGAFLAQEGTANAMLCLFYKVFFEPFAHLYEREGKDFAPVYAYFGAHICGIEEEHAHRARACALRACRSEDDLVLLRSSIEKFLSTQARVWELLLVALEAKDDNQKLVA